VFPREQSDQCIEDVIEVGVKHLPLSLQDAALTLVHPIVVIYAIAVAKPRLEQAYTKDSEHDPDEEHHNEHIYDRRHTL
jgi:hypothetical protein